ncbi:hypothetical protein D9M68_300500 [compost metagenome]
MDDRELLVSTMLLLHQNQVALAESVQVLSAWFRRHGMKEITRELQPQMELLLGNCMQIDTRLSELFEMHGDLARPA